MICPNCKEDVEQRRFGDFLAWVHINGQTRICAGATPIERPLDEYVASETFSTE